METAEFLQMVHGKADGLIAVSTVEPVKGSKLQTRFFAPDKIEQAAHYIEEVKDSKHVYVAAAPLHEKPPTGRGSEAYVGSVYCLHADIDILNLEAHSRQDLPPSIEEARGLLTGLPEPSLLLHTGNGLLALWLLSSRLKNLSYGSRILKGVQAHIINRAQLRGWHVDKTADLARIIRVAGTLNHKTTPAKPVNVLEGSGKEYSLSEFTQYLLPEQPEQPIRAKGTMSREQAQELLKFIPKQQAYEDWLRVLAALKFELGSEAAIELAEVWSPGTEGEIEYKLETLKDEHEKPATGGTLYYLAEQNGYIRPSTPKETDLGNAERLVERHGHDLCYVSEPRKWYVWQGSNWTEDSSGEVHRRARETVRSIYGEAEGVPDPEKRRVRAEWAIKSESQRHLEAMVSLAQYEESIPVSITEFDTDLWLLGVANGTLNLQTGELLSHSREHRITRLSPVAYDPDAVCPTWLSFLNRIMQGDKELTRYLQKAVGYALTGATKEQCLFLLHGTGANGKSTFIETLRALLGEYALQADFSTFLYSDSTRVRSDIARMRGARLVSAVEANEGKRLDEAVIKQLTGGDTVTARHLYEREFEYKPQYKIFLAANHLPTIRGTDNGIWRRLKRIPFVVTIPAEEQDRSLPAKLIEELPGILNWALEGCLIWQQEGLGNPKAVEEATSEYRSEQDVLVDFIADCCLEGTGTSSTLKDLHRVFTHWAKETGEYAGNSRWLKGKLEAKGIRVERGTANKHTVYGLCPTMQAQEALKYEVEMV